MVTAYWYQFSQNFEASLSFLLTLISVFSEKVSLFGELEDPGIAVPISDKNLSRAGHCHVRGLAESLVGSAGSEGLTEREIRFV